MMRVLWAVLLALPVFGQLQVSLWNGTTERSLTSLTDLGSSAMGDTVEFRFHARNNATAGIALQSLAVAGQAFALSSRPTLPYIVAPGNYVEFRVSFSPVAPDSYSAYLSVNGASFILKAAASAAPSLFVMSGPANLVLGGADIDFGRVQRNRSAIVPMQLTNTTAQVLKVSSIAVRGDAFRGPMEISLPVNLAAGASATFYVGFAPAVSGPLTGVLTVDSRSFNLIGTGYEAPLPMPEIRVSGAAIASAAQPKVSVRFATIPESSGTGTLTLDFQPSTPVVTDDPAVLFPTTGSRKLSYQVKEGNALAFFGGVTEIPFQTGTTAGKIAFTAQSGSYTETTTVEIAPAIVWVDTATALRRVSDLDVTITGFDNTRSAGKFNFRFYDRTGAVVEPGIIRVDVTQDFGRFFAISRVGGAFLVRATFPVAGDATQIGGVDVEIPNNVGIASPPRMNLP